MSRAWGEVRRMPRSASRLIDLTAPVLKVFVVVRLMVLVSVLIMHQLRPSYDLFGIVNSWDGGWYLRIARFGYPRVLGHTFTRWAFFPLMPAIVKVVHTLLPVLTWNEAGSAVSLAGGAVFVVVATVLAGDFFGSERGRQAGMILASFPGLYLSGLAYAEPVSLSFAAGALLTLGRRRYWSAGVLAGLAMLSSPLMLPIGVVVAANALRAQGRQGIRVALLAFLAPVLWSVVAWIRTGYFTAVLLAQRPWGLRLAWPWRAGTFGMLTTTIGAHGIFWMTLGSSIVTLALLWRTYGSHVRRIGTWWAYSLMVIAAVVSDTSLWLNPRFLLDAFPLVLVTGATVSRRLVVPIIVLGTSLTIVVLLAYTRFGDLFAQP
ncbi:MAG: hypothetical protein ACP5PJ_00875 [Acidimicrobiales bacterium]